MNNTLAPTDDACVRHLLIARGRWRTAAVLLSTFAFACLVFPRSGYAVCPEICDANDNAAVGEDALHDITTGTFNAAIGYDALTHIQSGSTNTACGAGTLAHVTTASGNTATGGFAL